MRHFDRILAEILDSIPESLLVRRVRRWWRIYEPNGIEVYINPEQKLFLRVDSCKGGRCVDIIDSLRRYVGDHVSIFYSDRGQAPEDFELLQAATRKETAPIHTVTQAY